MVLHNVELRNAVSMAIDRDFLAEKVWQLHADL